MSTNVYDILKERGFLEQETHAEVRDLLGKEKVTFYIGFDATADSPTDRRARPFRLLGWPAPAGAVHSLKPRQSAAR